MASNFLPFREDSRGSSAVEFALTLPCLIAIVLGGIAYGIVEATVHSAQQLAAEAARAAIAGLSTTERAALARSFVADNIANYTLLDPDKTSVAINDGSAPDYAFGVAVTIDLTGSFIYGLSGVLPMPAPTITRVAVIRRGGF